MYKKIEERKNDLLKASEDKRRKKTIYTFDEMCIKYRLTQRAFKNMLITYDFKGHFLPTKDNDDPFPMKIAKPSFLITCAKPTTDTSVIKQNQQSVLEQEGKDENILDEPIFKLQIAPTYGVKYRSGGIIIKGNEYNKNPMYNDSKMSLRTYYKTCGNRKGEGTSEESAETPSCENSKSRMEIYTHTEDTIHPLTSSKSATDKYYRPKVIISPNSKMFFTKPIDNTVIHKYNKSSTISYLNESGTKRNISATPQRLRNNKIIQVTLRKLKDNISKTRHKLPPPPLGYTTGYGIIDK